MAGPKLEARLGLDKREFEQGLQSANQEVSGFGAGMLKMGAILATVAVAFETVKKAFEATEAGMDKLTEVTEAVKGGYHAMMVTLGTGDWLSLREEINKTAKAYRDMAAAQDMITDIEASNKVKKAYLEKTLQSARVAAAAAEDPVLKAGYLQEAIDAQKAITSITVSEAKARMDAVEQSFITMAGFDEEASKLMIENFRKIAGNWETFYGVNGQLELNRIREQALAYKESIQGLNEAEKIEQRRLKAAIANLELFREFQNTMEPEEFNKYVEEISNYVNAIAQGDQALVRLTQSLKGVKDEVESITNLKGEAVKVPSLKTIPSLANEEGLQKGPSQLTAIQDMTTALQMQQEAVAILSDGFYNLFTGAEDGFKNMVESVLQGIARVVAELAAKAAILGLITLIFPGTALAGHALTGLKGMFTGFTGGGGLSMGSIGSSMGTQNLVAAVKGDQLQLILNRQ